MDSSTWLIALLCVLWVATALQCGLAINGYLMERQQGMRISLVRLGVVVAGFVLSTALVGFATVLPQDTFTEVVQPSQSEPAGVPPANAEVTKLRNLLSQQEQQLNVLQQQAQEPRA